MGIAVGPGEGGGHAMPQGPSSWCQAMPVLTCSSSVKARGRHGLPSARAAAAMMRSACAVNKPLYLHGHASWRWLGVHAHRQTTLAARLSLGIPPDECTHHERKNWPYSLAQFPSCDTKKPVSQLRLL